MFWIKNDESRRPLATYGSCFELGSCSEDKKPYTSYCNSILMTAKKALRGCISSVGDSWDAPSLARREQPGVLRYRCGDYMSARSHFDPKGSDDSVLRYVTRNSLNAANSI